MLAGGFGCGKSFADVLILILILGMYKDEYINVGIGGVSQKLLRETVLSDFFKVLNQAGIRYTHNSQQCIVYVGTIQFTYLSVSDPSTVYAHNFNIMLIDELDELPQEKVFEVIKACQERTRIVLPDGREPFIVITTTLQGLKGMYMLCQRFDTPDPETGETTPYVLIRGKTVDNKALSPKFVSRLYNLYTADEAAAFLEGKFVNLSTGRVYPEYDDRKHLYMPFPINPTEKLYVGQDFNAGYNASIVLVERNGIVFQVAEHTWKVVGDAPRLLREYYPTNPIVMVPDASAKEILSGFMGEIEAAGIEIINNTFNPSITERILAVNKLLRTGHMFIFSNCSKTALALKVRGFDDLGKPAKGRGPNALDHECDALEYAVWYIIHSAERFDDLLEVLRFMGTNKKSSDEQWRLDEGVA